MLADGEVIEYKDSATDVAFIAVVRRVRPSTSSRAASSLVFLRPRSSTAL